MFTMNWLQSRSAPGYEPVRPPISRLLPRDGNRPAGSSAVQCLTFTKPSVQKRRTGLDAAERQTQFELAGEPPAPVVLGDVWDALQEKLNAQGGFRPLASGFGKSYLQAPDGRTLALPNSRHLYWLPVAGDLLDLLDSWEVDPLASGK